MNPLMTVKRSSIAAKTKAVIHSNTNPEKPIQESDTFHCFNANEIKLAVRNVKNPNIHILGLK